MRITDNLRMANIVRNLGELQVRHAKAAQEASTGVRLDQASTDPLGASRLIKIEESIKRAETYRQNIAIARGDAETAEATLEDATNTLRRARELAMQGANDSLTAENRRLLAEEVRTLRDSLLALANREGSIGSVFSGFKTESPAFSQAGAYVGDDGERMLEIGSGLTIRVNVSGDAAFAGGTSGVNVFEQLDQLEAMLDGNDAVAVAATLDGINQAEKQFLAARADAGLILNRLDSADATLEHGDLTLQKRRSAVADADMVESVSSLTSLSQTLEQAISVAQKTLSINLPRF